MWNMSKRKRRIVAIVCMALIAAMVITSVVAALL